MGQNDRDQVRTFGENNRPGVGKNLNQGVEILEHEPSGGETWQQKDKSKEDYGFYEEDEDRSRSRRARREVAPGDKRNLHVMATVPISIPLSSIANVCNWTDGHCPKGVPGDPGTAGPTGATGQRGLPGPRGELGGRGRRGERGPPGHPGMKGDQGGRGEKGDPGVPGPSGPSGPAGPQGSVENCSCMGARRPSASPHQGTNGISLEDLEEKMRRLLMQSSFSVVHHNDTKDQPTRLAKVVINSFESVRGSRATNGSFPTGQRPLAADHTTSPRKIFNNGAIVNSSIAAEIEMNHEYVRPNDEDISARRGHDLNASKPNDQSDAYGSNPSRSRGRDTTDHGRKTAPENTNSPFLIRTNSSTHPRPFVTNTDDERTLTAPSDRSNDDGSITESPEVSNASRNGAEEEGDGISLAGGRARPTRPTRPSKFAFGDFRLEITNEKLMNLSILLERLEELTANKTSLLNFVQMSMSTAGPCGCPGPPGIPGLMGPIGETGPQGMVGMMGSPGVKGEPGEKGERGVLRARDGHIVQGPPGPKGDKGETGDLGPRGDPGVDGIDGVGLPGTKGEPGTTGIKGEPGERGQLGSKGVKGENGHIGPRGQIGYDGHKGPAGAPGVRGHKGVPGPTGPFGQRGIKGERGKIGETGAPGLPGLPGQPGERGPLGYLGLKGQKGDSFTPDSPGTIPTPTLSPPVPVVPAIPAPEQTPTKKPAVTEHAEMMFKIYEPIVQSKCRLTKIGVSREIHQMSRSYGAWMRESFVNTTHPDMIWVTMHHQGAILIEYNNIEEVETQRLSSTFTLPFLWDGTGHVVFNGSLFYHHKGTPYMLKYDLSRGTMVRRVRIPNMGYQSDLAFQFSSGHTNVDFAVDENGLWVIYPLDRPGLVGKLAVSKLDPKTLEIITTITTAHNFDSTANAFIVCGVLYTTKGPHSRPSRVDFAFDLLSEVELADTGLSIDNRYRKTAMLSYNPRDRLLYGWDRGWLVTYNLSIEENQQ